MIGLRYISGLNQPSSNEAGYIAHVNAAGSNLVYLPMSGTERPEAAPQGFQFVDTLTGELLVMNGGVWERVHLVPSLFSPLSLGSKLAVWVDPSDNDTLTLSGSEVLSVTNKGALGGTFVRGTTGPLVSSAGYAHQYFDVGGNTPLIWAGAISDFDFLSDDTLTFEVWVRFQHDAPGTGDVLLSTWDSATLFAGFRAIVNSTQVLLSTNYDTVGVARYSVSSSGTTGSTSNTGRIVSVPGVSLTSHLNNYVTGAADTTSSGASPGPAVNLLTLFRYVNNASAYDGKSADVIITKGALSTQEAALLHGYLSTRLVA